jgi:hypothetical protein
MEIIAWNYLYRMISGLIKKFGVKRAYISKKLVVMDRVREDYGQKVLGKTSEKNGERLRGRKNKNIYSGVNIHKS